MTTPETLREDFKKEFGSELTLKQLWLIVKLSKYVRLRARNNTAFNNLFNAIFSPYAKFKPVEKTRINRYSGMKETYPGLSIECNNNGIQLHEDGDDE